MIYIFFSNYLVVSLGVGFRVEFVKKNLLKNFTSSVPWLSGKWLHRVRGIFLSAYTSSPNPPPPSPIQVSSYHVTHDVAGRTKNSKLLLPSSW